MADSIKHFPFKEMLKSIPGFFGIRLEEEPKFEVVEEADGVEVRRYAPAVLAEVTVPGEHDEAIDKAFARLANYIFGDNSRREQMSMTTPVTQEPAPRSTTHPVTQAADGKGWTVSFFLGNDMAVDDAPTPDDPGIRLTRSPERLVAVKRFTWTPDADRRAESRDALRTWLDKHPTYQADGAVHWAQYDQPFVIPFLRRNEAQVEIKRR